MSVSHALQVGAKVVTVSSSGNHGASTAAYAARAGLRCVVFTLDKTPASMKTFMQAYGAVVVAMTTPEARWELLSRCVKEFGWYPTGNTTNPPIGSDYYGVEGYKTIAFELFEQFNQDVPEVVVVPTALGDVIQGVWKGFLELQALMGTKLPRMVAVEPSGSLTSAADYNLEIPPRVPSPHTLAFSSATTQSSYQALKAVRESGGASITIDEDPIIAATQLRLAQTEGVYGEAASVTSIAALAQLRDRGIVGPDDRIVCILTSGGLKDPSGTAQYLPVVPTLETTDLDRLLGAVADSYGLELP